MCNNDEKREFINSVAERGFNGTDDEQLRQYMNEFVLNNTPNGKLYKYRSFNKYAISNLEEGTLYCASPSLFNDPFDCKIGCNLNNCFPDIFEPLFKNVLMYLERFVSVYQGQVSMQDVDESEVRMLNSLYQNPKVMKFMDTYSQKHQTEDNFITKELWNDSFDVLQECIHNENNKAQIIFSIELVKKLIDKMQPSELAQLESEERVTVESLARIKGIDEDCDEISLARLLYQLISPEDSLAVEKSEEDFNIMINGIVQTINCVFRVGCLCADNKNRLMWSHYADSHKGFCIEYDFSSIYNELSDIIVLPVIYSKERQDIPWKLAMDFSKGLDVNETEKNRVMLLTLLTKDDEWNYEKEWRIIKTADNNDNIKMPPISCIYIGALCSKRNKSRLINIARKLGVPIKQMELDRVTYDLHAKLIPAK